jgi:hypothetical protein
LNEEENEINRRKMQQVAAVVILAAVCGLILLEAPAYAHRMLIRPIEPGILRVVYDDGTIARRAEVVLYGADDRELVRGKVDQEGYFKYNQKLPIVLVVADDGLGHRATWKYGEKVKEELPMLAKAVLVMAFLVFAAAFFHYRESKKKQGILR